MDTSPRKTGLTGAEAFWYVLGCVALGATYFAKVPVKKALADYGMVTMTAAEKFWYVVMCIGFGAGYFAKLPAAKALSEVPAITGSPAGLSAGQAPGVTAPDAAPAIDPAD